jgi:hypothetical protein
MTLNNVNLKTNFDGLEKIKLHGSRFRKNAQTKIIYFLIQRSKFNFKINLYVYKYYLIIFIYIYLLYT